MPDIIDVTPTPVKALNPQQQRFVDEYMVDRNGQAAYERAYGESKGAQQSASRLLSNAVVRQEVDKRIEEYSRTAGIRVVDLLKEAKLIAFSDIGEVFADDGSVLRPKDIPEGTRRALASAKTVEMQGGAAIGGAQGLAAIPMYTKEVKLWDKPAAIFKLLEYFKGVSLESSTPTVTSVTNVQINIENAMVGVDGLLAKHRTG